MIICNLYNTFFHEAMRQPLFVADQETLLSKVNDKNAVVRSIRSTLASVDQFNSHKQCLSIAFNKPYNIGSKSASS